LLPKLLEIASHAASLQDRLAWSQNSPRTKGKFAELENLFEEWTQNAARGDSTAFIQRLSWDHLEIGALADRLGHPLIGPNSPFPDWLLFFEKVIQTQHGSTIRSPVAQWILAHHPFPFEDLLVPFVQTALQEFRKKTGDYRQRLSEAAESMLARTLLARLCLLASLSFQREFTLFCQDHRSNFESFLANLENKGGRRLYDQFVRQYSGEGLIGFFQLYPVLARLMATVSGFWVDSQAELLERLSLDLDEIKNDFGWPVDPGLIVGTSFGLSDPHHGGRVVVSLSFASGQKLVYKPRSVGIEQAFWNFLGWLNDHIGETKFKTFRTVNKGSYGWVEFVEQAPCASVEELQQFYFRAGMQLYLVFLLDGTDCHFGNMIAHGPHPVLIDVETLFHLCLAPQSDGVGAHAAAWQLLWDSVLRTGMLPQWMVGKDAETPFNFSGLGAEGPQALPYRFPRWSHINTDQMTLEYATDQIAIESNLPIFQGKSQSISDHQSHLVEGFRNMHQALRRTRGELLREGSALHQLADQEIRFVYRPTRVYSIVLRELLHPNHLRSGLHRSLRLEKLVRAWIPRDGPERNANKPEEKSPPHWELWASELKSLEQQDIPFFGSSARETGIFFGAGQCASTAAQASFAKVSARLRSLDQSLLRRQISWMEGSFFIQKATHAALPNETGTDVLSPVPFQKGKILEAALKLAEELQATKIRGPDATVTWIAPQAMAEAQRYQLQRLDLGFFDGLPGLILFLAAAGSVTGDNALKQTALEALETPRRMMAEKPQMDRFIGQCGLGVGQGFGGVLYAMQKSSGFLQRPEISEEARQSALLITPSQIAADQKFDVLTGSAGAILSLVSLYESSRDSSLLDIAISCGNHLLQNRRVGSGRFRSWGRKGGPLLIGYAHGAAGIAYSLLRLSQFTGENRFHEAAVEAIEFERHFFIAEVEKHPLPPEANLVAHWCRGRAGIGLARLGGLEVLDNHSIREEIETALGSCSDSGRIPQLDYLCCGNSGRMETMIVGSEMLGRPELLDRARLMGARIVARAGPEAKFALHPLLPKCVHNPGFFTGTSGIGYVLLRLSAPEQVPPVLLFS